MSSVQPIETFPYDKRKTTYPICRPQVWKYYKDALKSVWVVEDVHLSQDVIDYTTKLTDGERRLVKHILAFFAASDGIVNVNLIERFKKDVDILEAGYFYDFQIAMENIHAEMYSVLLEAIIPSTTERNDILNAVETMPIITEISNYMYRCIESDEPFAARLLRMACVEGILFTGCFCVIYWLSQRGLMPALGHSNELIAKDEGLHTMFAMFLYTMISKEQQLTPAQVREIITEAVELAKKFIGEALPKGLTGMNANMMGEYIESQADNLVTLIDLDVIFNAKHDFKFMEQINLLMRQNFFERRNAEYSKASTADTGAFDVAEDF